MDIEAIDKICCDLPHVEKEIKWKSDLVFMIARKMFCFVDLEAIPTTIAFKVADEDYDAILSYPEFIPAPYFAQHKWVTVENIESLSVNDLTKYISASYELVKAKLYKKSRLEYRIA